MAALLGPCRDCLCHTTPAWQPSTSTKHDIGLEVTSPASSNRVDEDRTASPSGSPVSIDSLVKDYGSVRAVAGVSLFLQAGEFLALLGPSGSGKTTVLMCLAGFEKVNAGRIQIDDRDVTGTPPHRRDIGMVFQRYALFPHMSVLDNVAFPLRMRGYARDKQHSLALSALDLVRLPNVGHRRPHQLSGGQQQRVALARAIVFRPRLLLMDEPLGALDKKLRESLQLEIKELQRHLGTTVLYVTHDQHEALTMADRIAVMHDGLIQQIGNPQELYEKPANEFVADFIGETYFMDGQVVGDCTSVCTVDVNGVGRIRASPASPSAMAAGTLARVAVRPERAIISDGTRDEVGLAGTVTDAVYNGASTLYLVRLADNTLVGARISAGDQQLRRGDDVHLNWEPEHAHAFPRARQ